MGKNNFETKNLPIKEKMFNSHFYLPMSFKSEFILNEVSHSIENRDGDNPIK